MNIYMLVEGKRTEKKVYPRWMGSLLPELEEASDPFSMDDNKFYVFNGNGYPSILNNHLRNAVEDVNNIGRFQYFVMCVDADEVEVEYRVQEVAQFMKAQNIVLNEPTKFVLIIQNRCIETWFLGNKRAYKRNPSEERLTQYTQFYNVGAEDPELMGKIDEFETHAQFHASYLVEMLLERNIRYTKKNPAGVANEAYLKELINRSNETGHIATFRTFLDFCEQVKRDLSQG